MTNINDAFDNNKILYHGDRLKQYIDTGKTIAPITLTLDLTNICNNKCPKCVTRFKNKDTLDYKFIINLFYDLKELGIKGIQITGGGEPLLHPRVVDIVELGNSLGFSMGLVTSGQYVEGIDRERLIRNLKWIRISLDAGTPEHYKETHGLDEYKFLRVINFIKSLCAIKIENDLPIIIGASYLVSLWDKEREEEDIHEAVKKLQIQGFNYFQIKQFHGNKIEIDYLDKTKKLSWLKTFNIELYNTFKTRRYPRNYNYCHGAHFTTSISADGKLYACCHLKNEEMYPIADLKKVSILHIWNSEKMLDIIKDIDINKCIKYCKYNTLNYVLENTLQKDKSVHKDFL